MKKLMILPLLSLIYIPTVFSDINKCNKVDSIHCVYYSGDQSNNGRYVKVTINSISHIRCTKADTFDFIPQHANNNWSKPKQVSTYDQCFDETCKKVVRLATDNFTIAKNGNRYASNPHIFEVQLLNYGKTCS